MIRTKVDYPPILSPGRHRVGKTDLFQLFVADQGVVRVSLHYDLLKFLQELEQRKITCEVWIDGSFACKKESPGDVDLVVVVWHEIFESLEKEAQEFLLSVNDFSHKYADTIDAYVCIEYPKDHPSYELDNPDQYVDLFGSESSGQWLKGFAVVSLEGAQ